MLIESITLAQRDNKELEALIYRFRPLIRKCGRQLHIEDGEQEMVVAFIELIKRFRPERLRSQDDGKVVQSVNQIKLKALNKLKSQISAHSSSGGGDSK